MSEPRGRYLPLSIPRRMVCDLLHFGRQVPTVPVQRRMNLAPLRDARADWSDRIPWTILFTRAYAQLARDFAVLRQAYLRFPWDRVYEHPHSNAAITIEREYQGETIVVSALFRAPETRSLVELHRDLEDFRTRPLESLGHFRKLVRIARFPRFVRRWMWWYGLNVSGERRAKYVGTFGVSVYSALGAESLHPIAPWTTTLNYGILEPDGTIPVRLIYDHRLMDGATIARALGQLEQILNGEIVRELTTTRPGTATAA